MAASQGNRKSWLDWFPVREHFLQDQNSIGMKKKSGSVFMIDVAGGRGHHLDEFSKRFPDVPGRLILQDLPAVIDDIKELDPRIEKMKVDMFEPQAIKGLLPALVPQPAIRWPQDKADSWTIQAPSSTTSISSSTTGLTSQPQRFSRASPQP